MGLKPDEFWMSTLREIFLMCKSFNTKQYLDWERTRSIEFSTYNVQYGMMDGKKIFKNIRKPSDLYKLPTDKAKKPVKIDKERAIKAVEKYKKQWQVKKN